MGASKPSLMTDHPIIEAMFHGRVTKEAADEAVHDILLLAGQMDVWSVLTDCTDLVWTPPITNLSPLADALNDLGVADRFRQALIKPQDVTAAVAVGFWETLGANRGLAIRVFRDRDEAITWLTG